MNPMNPITKNTASAGLISMAKSDTGSDLLSQIVQPTIQDACPVVNGIQKYYLGHYEITDYFDKMICSSLLSTIGPINFNELAKDLTNGAKSLESACNNGNDKLLKVTADAICDTMSHKATKFSGVNIELIFDKKSDSEKIVTYVQNDKHRTVGTESRPKYAAAVAAFIDILFRSNERYKKNFKGSKSASGSYTKSSSVSDKIIPGVSCNMCLDMGCKDCDPNYDGSNKISWIQFGKNLWSALSSETSNPTVGSSVTSSSINTPVSVATSSSSSTASSPPTGMTPSQNIRGKQPLSSHTVNVSSSSTSSSTSSSSGTSTNSNPTGTVSSSSTSSSSGTSTNSNPTGTVSSSSTSSSSGTSTNSNPADIDNMGLQHKTLPGLLIESVKQDRQRAIDKAKLERQRILDKQKELSDSSAFENTLIAKERELFNQTMDKLNTIDSALSKDNEIVLKQLKEHQDIITQCAVELDSLHKGTNFTEISECKQMYQSLCSQFDNIKSSLKRCPNNWIDNGREIVYSGLFKKTLDAINNMTYDELNILKKNIRIIIGVEPKCDDVVSFGSAVSATFYTTRDKLIKIREDITNSQLATIIAIYGINNITDTMQYIYNIVTLVNNQNIQSYSDHKPLLWHQYFSNVKKITSSGEMIDHFVNGNKEREDFIQEINISGLRHDVTVKTPLLVTDIPNDTEGAIVLQEINRVTNAKIESTIENKLSDDIVTSILSTSIDNFDVKVYSDDYYSRDTQGDLMKDSLLEKVMIKMDDFNFTRQARLIDEKLNQILENIEESRILISKCLKTSLNLPSVSITRSINDTFQTNQVVVNNFAVEKAKSLIISLDIQKSQYISLANQAIQRLLFECKINAIKNTLESAIKSMQKVSNAMNSIKQFIPTKSEITALTSYHKASVTAVDIVQTITDYTLSIGINLSVLALIPFQVIDKTLQTVNDSIPFNDIVTKVIDYTTTLYNYTFEIINKCYDTIDRILEALYYKYDIIIFSLQKDYPVISFIVLGIIYFAFATFMLQNSFLYALFSNLISYNIANIKIDSPF